MWLAEGRYGWNLWVWIVGVVVRRYIDFLILLILMRHATSLSAVWFVSDVGPGVMHRCSYINLIAEFIMILYYNYMHKA